MSEVICIDDKLISPLIPNKPVEGDVYTIRQVVFNPDHTYGLLLEEVVNRKVPYIQWGMTVYIEPNFHVRRFSTLSGESLTMEEINALVNPGVEVY